MGGLLFSTLCQNSCLPDHVCPSTLGNLPTSSGFPVHPHSSNSPWGTQRSEGGKKPRESVLPLYALAPNMYNTQVFPSSVPHLPVSVERPTKCFSLCCQITGPCCEPILQAEKLKLPRLKARHTPSQSEKALHWAPEPCSCP